MSTIRFKLAALLLALAAAATAASDYPLQPRVDRWLRASHSPVAATSLTREDYLRVAEGVVRYFLHHQAEDGRVTLNRPIR